MTHEELQNMCASYVQGTLVGGELEAFTVHLPKCAECRQRLREVSPAPAKSTPALPPVAPSPEVRARLLEHALNTIRSSKDPEQIGRYSIQGRIGSGGFGVVYRAHDPSLSRDVALKLLARTSENGLRRFLREAKALGKLDHPNIVRVFDCGEYRGQPYLVMELLQGGSLGHRLGRSGTLPPREAAALTRDLASALHHAHLHGIVHRDLKPENVLVDERGTARLTDFGLARDCLADQSRLTVIGTILGSPGYWSPEQASGRAASAGPPSDVFSLGAVLYTALTGSSPFGGGTLPESLALTMWREPPPPSMSNPDCGSLLDAICLRCLSKAPEDRYSSGELQAKLSAYLNGTSPPTARRRLLPLTSLVSFAAVVLALAVYISAANRVSEQERLPPPDRGVPREASPGESRPDPEDTGLLRRLPEDEEPRISPDAVAVYSFHEGTGARVHDKYAGLDLQLSGTEGQDYEWVPSGGLWIKQQTRAESFRPPAELVAACQESNEISLEVYFSTEDWEQGLTHDLARILTVSNGSGFRNFSLGLQGRTCGVRLRTRQPVDVGTGNGMPAHYVPLAPQGALHVMYTRGADGAVRMFVNGSQSREVSSSGPRSPLPPMKPGDFTVWDLSMRLALFDEFVHPDRFWLGKIYFVAVYRRSLGPDEVARRLRTARKSYPHANR